MTSRYRAGIIWLTLAALPMLAPGAAAQTVEDAPTNCCAEVYWAGWELGRLRSIASYPTEAYTREARRHMDRLSTTLQAANETCCQFCEAWAEWSQLQDGIRATTGELLDSAQSDTVEARRAFREWVDSRPAVLVEGLNRCDLEDGMPCKWLGLVACARAYFQLGENLGHAMHALAAVGEGVEAGQTGDARLAALESMEKATGRMTALRAGGGAPRSSEPPLDCTYLWEAETGAARLLSEVLREADKYSDAQLAAKAAEVHRLVLGLLVEGNPDLGIPPCPIGAPHDHADCEFAEEHGQ